MKPIILDIDVTRGNTWKRTLVFENDNGGVFDITNWKVFFTAKEKITDLDVAAKISKTITVHTAPLEGETTISLTAIDTDIAPGSYIYDIKFITDSAAEEITIISGIINILHGITLRDS
jgi:hypothetical protein